MQEKTTKGILLDVDYVNREEGSAKKSVIRLFASTGKGIEAFEDWNFKPYFYVKAQDLDKAEKALGEAAFGESREVKVKSIERVKRANAENILRLSFENVQDLVAARAEVLGIEGILEKAEHDIPFARRWLLDHEAEPMNGIEIFLEGNKAKKVKIVEREKPEFRVAAFDLETLSPGRFSDPKQDPILMASFAMGKEAKALGNGQVLGKNAKVLSYGKGFGKEVDVFEDEKAMVKGLEERIREKKPDVIATYNGDLFDFPYIKERAERLGLGFAISSDGSQPKLIRKGRDNAAKLVGVQHLDVYQMLRFLARFAVVSLVKFDLESVVNSLYSIEKEKIKAEEINKIWGERKGLDRLAEYCAEDSAYTLKIAEQYLPLVVELCKIVKQPLFEVGRASASMLVEFLIMEKCFETGRLIANKPDDAAVQQRLMHPIKGGYVKEPLPGLHENIAVLDFSSLYPTIIISHNVSPDTVGCPHKECMEKNLAPNKQWFCSKKSGLIPEILETLFERRIKLKRQAKKLDRKSPEFVILNARQQALKILLNSFYGYLLYSRSRFYSREAGSAVTAWGRQYVQWVGSEAEKAGFELLYNDTDSAFLIIPAAKERKDVLAFVEKINKELPGVMNVELEGFFKRGIFVTKESGEGAKKKYALIDYEGNLKIVGFEYVRRDWAPIAKETQRQVINAILQEGNPEKAIEIIREKINALSKGNAKKSELTVLTQIKRPLEKYESIGPHVAAAKKAAAKGREIGIGSIIGYVITRSGKSISDKAQLAEYVNEGNYDPNYYIQNQVLPAVMKIIREFNVSREDLLQGGKQSKLGAFS
ncbi:MAG: DNA polymerase [Candidatus Diapherotrites archaeon]|uniref:DNA-directed DNA polymerase n=1 Tax=Candidatus Iainarchaeum sp. TaxID=3101447 RepID=A0A938YYP0_9ARCH|nr:DNA polymerase [Candidatus Diapherotrites archaeon]